MKKISQFSLVAVILTLATGLLGPISVHSAGPATIDLGSAENFVILAKSGISTTGTTSITGNIGVSPIAATAMTGFALSMDSTNTFSTSELVTGKAYAADYSAPTPTTMSTAINDMETAYTTAAGRTLPTSTELGAGNIGGMTLSPGLYKWTTGVTIPTDLTLSGGADDVWIFQIAQTLTTSSGTEVILSGGANAANIFWQVAGQTTLGTTSVFNGNILGKTAIVMNTGATLNGRALAQTAVTLDANTIAAPTAVSDPIETNTNSSTNTNTNTSTNTNANANTNTSLGTNTNTANANTNVSVLATDLPNTGVGPKTSNNALWYIIPFSIIFMLVASSLVVALKKQKS